MNYINQIENLSSEELKSYKKEYNQKKLGGMFLGFNILKKEEISFSKILKKLEKEWNMKIENFVTDDNTLKTKYDCYEILLKHYKEVLPSALENAFKNHTFSAKTLLKSQVGYVAVAVIKTDAPDYKGSVSDKENEENIKTATLFSKITATIAQATPSVAVEYNDIVIKADDYIERTTRIKEIELPIPIYNFFFVGFSRDKEPFNFNHIYSTGLEDFYKRNMEVNYKKDYIEKSDAFDFLQYACVHMIINNYILEDKDTISLEAGKEYGVNLLKNDRLELMLINHEYVDKTATLFEEIKKDLSKITEEIHIFYLKPHNNIDEENPYLPYKFSLILNDIEKVYTLFDSEVIEKEYADEDFIIDWQLYDDASDILNELFIKIIFSKEYELLNKSKKLKPCSFAFNLFISIDNETSLIPLDEAKKYTAKLIKKHKDEEN